MDLEWYGQSAFRLSDGERTVLIDPFDDMSLMAGRGMKWDDPAIEGVTADLLLVTHEHFDHNGVGAIGGGPVVLRRAGTHESPVGEVVGIASEDDDVAGTQRGPNTLFVFSLGGMRVARSSASPAYIGPRRRPSTSKPSAPTATVRCSWCRRRRRRSPAFRSNRP
jgi:hypothetical protein